MNRFTSLHDAKFKILGLTISIISIGFLLVLKLLNFDYEEGWEDRIFIMNHFIIIFSLYIIMYSREKFDDERVQQIRYVLMKGAYALTVCCILIYTSITTLDRVDLSIYIILYIVEAVLLFYQIMFRYCLLTNPGWIFKERKKKEFPHLLFIIFIDIPPWVDPFVVAQYKL